MSTMTPKSMFFYFVHWMYDVIWCRTIFHCSFLYVIVLKVSISFANKNISEFLSHLYIIQIVVVLKPNPEEWRSHFVPF